MIELRVGLDVRHALYPPLTSMIELRVGVAVAVMTIMSAMAPVMVAMTLAHSRSR